MSSHLLSEVEQICDKVMIIDRGRLLKSGRMEELLAAGDRVEIFANDLPAEMEPELVGLGATMERSEHGVRIEIGTAHKRMVAEKLWAAGYNVVSLQPVRASLEELYMKVVGEKEAASKVIAPGVLGLS